MKVLDNLLLSLKIISKIPENGRVKRSKSGALSLEKKSGFSSFTRFWNRDSRKKCIEDINNLIDFAIERSNDIVNTKYYEEYGNTGIKNPLVKNKLEREHQRQYEILDLIQEDLQKSIKGLVNLKTTYQSDATIVSQIDIIITKIRNHLSDIDKNPTKRQEYSEED